MNEELDSVCITQNALSELITDCTLRYPEEACGLLGADFPAGQKDWMINAVIPMSNIHPLPQSAFAFDPQEWVSNFYEMPKNRQLLAGIYHSHPHAPPEPSSLDRSGYIYNHQLYWIISLDGLRRGSEPIVQPYRFANGQFQLLTLLVIA